MLYAKAKVTAIGKPSGTETTINVTAIINVCNKYERKFIKTKGSPLVKYNIILPTTINPAIAYPNLETKPPSLSNCSFKGVRTLESICAAVKTLPFSVLSPTANTLQIPCPSITFVPFIT